MVQSQGTGAREASRRRHPGARSGTGEQPARHGARRGQRGSAGRLWRTVQARTAGSPTGAG